MNGNAPRKAGPVPGRLSGKRVLVTGAGSGIGRSVSIRMAMEGAKTGLLGRRKAMLEETSRLIGAAGGSALVLPADIGAENEVLQAIGSLRKAWGGLDVLVAVAGVEPATEKGDDRVDRLALQDWEALLKTNLTGTFLSCKHALRAMLDQGKGGAIIITGSPTGLFGLGLGQHAYSASKAGCHGLVRVMAAEYAPNGIRVNCVIPGLIDTPPNADILADPAALEAFCRRIPMRRAGQPEEVAGIYAWLASDEASYVTGAYFAVDGGMTATV